MARVNIGANVVFGPDVHDYTALYPMSAAERRLELESGQPVSSGDDVWVGGGAIICRGVSIGSDAVIGAGSVVTRSIAEMHVCGRQFLLGDSTGLGSAIHLQSNYRLRSES